ncbi:MAG: ABC transporter ATP-binding protein [Gammaproteobacteria bacterium]
MLSVEGLSSSYGNIIALHDASLFLAPGETLSLIGPNGAGKTTTLMTIAGLVRPRSGRVLLDGEDITTEPARRRVGRGIALVPEGRRLFADLTVNENLTVGGHHLARVALEANRERVLTLFPWIAGRLGQLAGSLSGGEQQMLAIGRAIMSGPRLLLVDELSLGLMPKVVDECYDALHALKAQGLATILVEQNTGRAATVADSVVVLDSGHAVWSGSGDEARADPKALSVHF